MFCLVDEREEILTAHPEVEFVQLHIRIRDELEDAAKIFGQIQKV